MKDRTSKRMCRTQRTSNTREARPASRISHVTSSGRFRLARIRLRKPSIARDTLRNADGPRAIAAFTMVELMVVMAVIIIMVSLLIPTIGAIKKRRVITVAQGELNQVATAIESYHAKRGYYPPDNPGNPLLNPLYFELEGTVYDPGNQTFTTLDGSSRIAVNNVPVLFNNPLLTGFANSSRSKSGSDESAAAVNFLPGLRPVQVGQMTIDNGQPFNALLACSVTWRPDPPAVQELPLTHGNVRNASPDLNPWRYVSTNPTNNPGSYDLWVDFPVGTKIYRVSNWSKQPQVVKP